VVLALLIAVAAAGEIVELGERDDGSIVTFDKVVGRGKPSLVFFYLPGCGHCRGFHPEFDAAAGHFDSSSVVFAKVNAERWDILAKKYDVSRVPDIRYCTSSGDCQHYPEYAPNTESGVVEYLEGKIGSRFVATSSDVETAHELSTAEKLKVQLTKGTCPVVYKQSLVAEAAAAEEEDLSDESEDEASEEEAAEDEETAFLELLATDGEEGESEEEEVSEEADESEEAEESEEFEADESEEEESEAAEDLDEVDSEAEENDSSEELAADEEVIETI